jgi:hypothetical protein
MTVTVSVYALATLVNTTHTGIILYYVTLTKLNKLCRFEQGLYLQVFYLTCVKLPMTVTIYVLALTTLSSVTNL